MPDLVYGTDSVEAARIAVATQAQRARALRDAVGPAPAGALGGLADGGLGAAVDRLRGALCADLAAAGDRLSALERALDATERSMQHTDRHAAASLTPGR